MKSRIFAIIVVLPIMSFAQNGSVSFGYGANPPATSNAASAAVGMGFDAGANQLPPPCPNAMDRASFQTAKEGIAKAAYEDAKFSAAKAIVAANCMSAEQVADICRLFGFEQTKLNFARLSYARTSDRANFSKVAATLTYESSRKNLNDFVANGGR